MNTQPAEPPYLLRNLLILISLDSTHEECACAGLLTIRAEKDLHWQLLPHCASQSEGVNAPALFTPHHSLTQEQHKDLV